MASFSIESIWRALHDAHEPADHPSATSGAASLPGQAWTRVPGPSGLDSLWSFGRSSAARVMRLRHALEDSLPLAFEQLQRMLGAITLADVRQVLVTLVRDIALVWCGSVLLGSGVGGIVGAFGGGVGAIPGAALGAEVGAAAGEALLALFGLKALAESMVASMPRALRAWRQGARDAWDDPPFGDPRDEHDTFRTRQAAWELAQGHLALLQALLTALLAMLARGGTARALALHEISANGRLGPAVARWLEEQEVPLRQALSRVGLRGDGDVARGPAAAAAPVLTPSQLQAEQQARAPMARAPTASPSARARVGNRAEGAALARPSPPREPTVVGTVMADNIAANRKAVADLGIPNRLSPRQDLHVPPVTDGRSVLTADPAGLLQRLVDGNCTILRTPKSGQAIVDFGEPIGEYWRTQEGVPTLVGPTNYGSVMFGKNGTHIIPANPLQW